MEKQRNYLFLSLSLHVPRERLINRRKDLTWPTRERKGETTGAKNTHRRITRVRAGLRATAKKKECAKKSLFFPPIHQGSLPLILWDRRKKWQRDISPRKEYRRPPLICYTHALEFSSLLFSGTISLHSPAKRERIQERGLINPNLPSSQGINGRRTHEGAREREKQESQKIGRRRRRMKASYIEQQGI